MRVPAALLAAILLAAGLHSAPASVQARFKKSYRSDLDAFLKEAQQSYPYFDLKGIRKDWNTTRKRLVKEIRHCKSDPEFLDLVGEAISCLRDAHMYLSESAVESPKVEPEYYSGLSFLPATDERVVVMVAPQGKGAWLRSGMIVLRIDGQEARKLLEARSARAWEAGGSFSSPQRARLFEYRIPLRGERGEKHELVVLDGKHKKLLKLSCRAEVQGWPHTYNLPEGLERVGRSFSFTILPSGVGYQYLRRVDSSIPEGMAKAQAAHPEAKGWIVDLRGNGGGGYGQELIDRIAAMPRPVAVILDAGCISAGETLARDFVNLAGARLFGGTTAGSSSSKRDWSFPSGIATVKFSTRSRTGLGGQLIEFHGIAPDVEVEAVPEEVLAGKNSAILRAEAFLLGG